MKRCASACLDHLLPAVVYTRTYQTSSTRSTWVGTSTVMLVSLAETKLDLATV